MIFEEKYINYFIFGIIFLILFYLIYKIDMLQSQLQIIEKFDSTSDAIQKAVNDVYTADVEAIRNLSNLASTLTISGKLTVPGGLKLNDGSNNNIVMNADGSASFANGKVTIDADGNITSTGNINIKGSANFGNNKTRINNEGYLTVDTEVQSKSFYVFDGGQIYLAGITSKINFNSWNIIKVGSYGIEFSQISNECTPIKFKWQYNKSGQIYFNNGDNGNGNIVANDGITTGQLIISEWVAKQTANGLQFCKNGCCHTIPTNPCDQAWISVH